jgi:hypothetical protein
LLFPTIAARQDEDRDVVDIEIANGLRGQYRDPSHRLDRVCGETDDLDAVLTVAPKLRDRVRRLPIREAWHDKQVHGLTRHLVMIRGLSRVAASI